MLSLCFTLFCHSLRLISLQISGLANMLKIDTEKAIRGVDSDNDAKKMPLGRTHTLERKEEASW